MNARFSGVLQPLRDLRETQAAGRFSRWMASSINALAEDLPPVSARTGMAGFVVLPWPTFALLPEYILALAMAFRLRGREVGLVWDDTIFGSASVGERAQHRRIRKLLESMPHTLPVFQLSRYSPDADDDLSGIDTAKLAEQNAIRRFLSETLPDDAQGECALFGQSMARAAGRIQALLRQQSFDYLVVPGGIYRTSGLYMELGKRAGVRVATFDSDGPVLYVSTDGVAAHHDDIPRVFDMFPDNDEMVNQGHAELARRTRGEDIFSYQTVVAEGCESTGGVLVPLNQSFDTAALGRHRLFRNQTEWMLALVAWVLEHTEEDIVVRRHPVERKTGMHSNDDYEGLLRKRFGPSTRIRFVRPDEQVNTYDLIEGARVVLPHTSTVGIEAAALGKPVVVHSDCYYAGLGFVWNATTRDEYFNLIGRAISGEIRPSEQQRRAAWKCYYLTQRCDLLEAAFTPESIRNLVDGNLRATLRGPDLDSVFEAIDGDRPLCLMTHLCAVGR